MDAHRWSRPGNSEFRTAVTIHAAGNLLAVVRTHGQRDAAGSYLAVSIGRTVFFAHDRASVNDFHAAWRKADTYGAEIFTEPRPAMTVPSLGQDITAAVDIRGRQARPAITAMVGRVSPNGLAHIRLALGAVTVCVYDTDALDAYLSTWRLAAEEAKTLFCDDMDAFEQAETAQQEYWLHRIDSSHA